MGGILTLRCFFNHDGESENSALSFWATNRLWKMKIKSNISNAILVISIAVAIAVGYVWFSEQSPKNVFESALRAYESGDDAQLEADVSLLSRDSRYPHRFHLVRGMALKRKKMPREALIELGEALGDQDTTALSLALSGEIFYEAGQLVEAERMLQAAVQSNANLVNAHRLLIATYYDTGAMNNALEHIARVQKLAPRDIRPWRLEGLILKDFEKFDEAIRAYSQALELSPSQQLEIEIRTELAECLIQVRRHDEALQILSTLGSGSEVFALRTECLLAMGRDKEAAKALADGLHLDPGNLKMLTTEITLLREKDSQVEAIAKLEKAITLHPYDFNLRSLAMLAYQKQGELELAAKQQESMKKLRALKDKFAELHVAAIKDPNDVESRVLLGKVAVELGMLDAAANWYRVALGMDPSNPVARQELSKLMSGETSSQTSDHSNRR